MDRKTRAMTDRELDAWIAVNVMGIHDGFRIRGDWHPSDDARADYEVLRRARTWIFSKRQAFIRHLHQQWTDRVNLPSGGVEVATDRPINYVAGDYSRAAYAVLTKEPSDAH